LGGATSEQVVEAGAGAGAAAGVTTPRVTTGLGKTVAPDEGDTACAVGLTTGLPVAVATGE